MAMGQPDIFQSVKKSRLADEVARQIVKAIREGRYRPGDRLPAERDLAVEFGVSRPVLRESLRMLHMQEYVSIRHGQGTIVKDPAANMLHIPVDEWIAKHREAAREFYEARLAVEPVCAALAAIRATDEQIASLKANVEEWDEAFKAGLVATSVAYDIDFHGAIARMSGNPLLHKMLVAIISPESDIRKVGLRTPGHLPVAHQGHMKIMEAIERRDPEAARQAMIDALNEGIQRINSVLDEKDKETA